jgi:rubredoxin
MNLYCLECGFKSEYFDPLKIDEFLNDYSHIRIHRIGNVFGKYTSYDIECPECKAKLVSDK